LGEKQALKAKPGAKGDFAPGITEKPIHHGEQEGNAFIPLFSIFYLPFPGAELLTYTMGLKPHSYDTLGAS